MPDYSVSTGQIYRERSIKKINFKGTYLDFFSDHLCESVQIIDKKPYLITLSLGNSVFRILLLKEIQPGKEWLLKINGKRVKVSKKSSLDVLLNKMGMNTGSGTELKNIKAPMPGKILKLLVQEGQDVKKGDVLFVLEAMKMENAIKSPGDGVLKKVLVQAGQTVEKNQVLMEF